METIRTGDTYECCYYLLNGCELVNIESVLAGDDVNCQFVLMGKDILKFQQTYFKRTANVNLYSFRSALKRVNSSLRKAKKKFAQSLALLEEGGQV